MAKTIKSKFKITTATLLMVLSIIAFMQFNALATDECEHSYDVWQVSYEATCLRTGLQSRTCLLCGETQSEEIPKTEHSYSNWIVSTAAGCETTGIETAYCLYCMTSSTRTIEATGHSYEDFYTIDIEPTYLYTGTKSNHCSNCDSKINSTVADVLEVQTVQNVCTTATSSSSISLSWDKVDYATAYIVYQYIDSSWIRVQILDSSINYCTIEGLSTGTVYKFKLKAYVIEDGTTVYGSATDTHTTGTGPSATTITSNSETDTAIRINWQAVTGALGYKVMIYQGETRLETAFVDADTYTYRFANLYTLNEYYFEVYAYTQDDDEILYGDCSADYSAYTDPIELDMLDHSCTLDSVTLNWETEYNASGYRVYINLGSGYTSIKTLSGGDISQYTVDNLDSGTTYLFKVKAYFYTDDGTLWGLASEAYSAATLPPQVIMTTFTNTTTAIRINWNEISSATGYLVYIYNAGDWILLSDINDSSTTTYRCENLVINTAYIFKVQAYLVIGDQTFYGEESEMYVAFTDPS